MTFGSEARFDRGAAAWADYNRTPLGRIRRDVTWHNLVPRLPVILDAQHPPRILDMGGGSGELALRLIQRGYRVWLADSAPAMLEEAQRSAERLPDGAGDRLVLCEVAVEDASRSFSPGSFEAIVCHTLIEYLPEPRATLSTLTGLLAVSGLLSLSFVNRHAEVLRQAWSRGNPKGALNCLEEGTFCAGLFDITGTAYTAEQAKGWLEELGLTVKATCGIRFFADYVPRERLDDAEFFDDLLSLERAVSDRPPYSALARYVQLIASKPVEL